ncbi:MAG: tetratricopeptide repeat protein [Syntrophales bacterium]|nr:tetratricopeptide repeat protein [Syntrophales bacterium]
MARKIKKKDFSKSEELRSVFDKITNYISENRSKVLLVFGILVFIMLSLFGWNLYQSNYEKNAEKMHLLAFSSYQKNDNNRGTYLNAIELYKKVVGKYPGSNAAIHSLYSMGNIYFNINEIDKSINAYEQFIKESNGNNDLVVLAYIGLGYCYESKGNLKEALNSLDNSIKYSAGSSYKGIIYRNMGRIYEEMNDSPKAIEYYEKALKLTADPSMEMLIKRKISTLG